MDSVPHHQIETPQPPSQTPSQQSLDVFNWNTGVTDITITSPTQNIPPKPLQPKTNMDTPSSTSPRLKPERDSMATDIEMLEPTKDDLADWKPQRQEYMIMITLATISLIVALDATIIGPILPTLATLLHGTASEAFWTGTSYLLTNAVFQPFIAALSDIFGRREFVLLSLILFTVGSVICCVAQNFTQLLAGRCVQGVGGGGIVTLSQVIYADIVPLRQRPKYFSIVLGAWALGTVLGPLIGGLFVQKATWRWCFYINLPICAIGLLMVTFFLKLSTEKTSLKSKLARVDWIGGFLFISGMTSFLIAVSWGGVQFHGTATILWSRYFWGALGVIGSLVWERYGAKEPFLVKVLFHDVSSICAYICALFQGLELFMALYYLPFYFSAVRFKSPIDSGLNIFPATCFNLPGSVVISALITRSGRFRWALWMGWAIATLGAGLFILYDAHTSTAVWAIIQCIFGTGMGILLSAVNFTVQAMCQRAEDAGRAAAMYSFCRSVGMSLGVAIGGSIMQNLMATDLRRHGLPTEIARNAEAYVATLRTLDPSSQLRAGVIHAYVHGFHGIFGVMTAICGVGLLLSLLVKHRDMDKILMSKYNVER